MEGARTVVALWILSASALAASGCGGGGGAPATQPSPKATVVLTDGAYRPSRLTIEAGSRVTFVNTALAINTVETDGAGFFALDRRRLARRGQFDLHTLQPGEAESVTFDRPGVYRYHSSFEPEMKGVVVVTAPR